jgi:hypothetical protein
LLRGQEARPDRWQAELVPRQAPQVHRSPVRLLLEQRVRLRVLQHQAWPEQRPPAVLPEQRRLAPSLQVEPMQRQPQVLRPR